MINKLAIQSVLILCSLLVSQAAFAENSTNKIVRTPSSNLVSDRPITFDNYTSGTEQAIPTQQYRPTSQNSTSTEGQNLVNINMPSQSSEQHKFNYLYGGIDIGMNTFFVNSRRLYTTTSGLQLAGKLGYSMSGPRVELESSIGYLADGGASFTGTGVNAYYDFQTGSIRPYIGIGYGFGSLIASGSSSSGAILQYKLGVSSENSPGSNTYVELRVVQSPEENRAGIASFNAGSTFRF
jgi:hypothetical protein